MICEQTVRRYCRDDISKIENYNEVMSDTTQTYDCHHRLELTLDGDFAHSRDELKRLGMYYDRPYFELIFLTHTEHQRLHNTDKKLSDETRAKMSVAKTDKNHPQYGKKLSDETRAKISVAMTGKNNPQYGKKLSVEHRAKLSVAKTGKPKTAEHRAKMAETRQKLATEYRSYKQGGGKQKWKQWLKMRKQ